MVLPQCPEIFFKLSETLSVGSDCDCSSPCPDGAACYNEVCQCIQNYFVESADGQSCVPISKHVFHDCYV